MKPYPPVLKDKERYLMFTVQSDAKFTSKQVWDSLKNHVKEIIGLKGIADSAFTLIAFDEKNQKG